MPKGKYKKSKLAPEKNNNKVLYKGFCKKTKSSPYNNHFFCSHCTRWVKKTTVISQNETPRCPICLYQLRVKARFNKRGENFKWMKK